MLTWSSHFQILTLLNTYSSHGLDHFSEFFQPDSPIPITQDRSARSHICVPWSRLLLLSGRLHLTECVRMIIMRTPVTAWDVHRLALRSKNTNLQILKISHCLLKRTVNTFTKYIFLTSVMSVIIRFWFVLFEIEISNGLLISNLVVVRSDVRRLWVNQLLKGLIF